MDIQEYIEGLNGEISAAGDFSRTDVYDTFERFICDKEFLHSFVDMGIFSYEYVWYKGIFEGTLFDEVIEYVISLFRIAYAQCPNDCAQIFQKNYYDVSKGYASHTQLAWLHNTSMPQKRLDLFVKSAFEVIGDCIECSLHPHLLFTYQLIRIADGKATNEPKLGIIVNELINKKDILQAVYRDMLFGISIAQWRNIAYHSNYSINGGKIKIWYGEKQQKEAVFVENDILQVLHAIDALLYMHKTIHTLLSVDFYSILDTKGVLLSKSQETLGDDIIIQIAESAYVFGLLLVDYDRDNDMVILSIRREPISQPEIENFLRVAFNLLKENFKILIYSGSKVKFKATLEKRKLSIMEYDCNEG